MKTRYAANSGSGRLIWAASESSADMLYASGFMAPDPFLWFECSGRAGIVVSPLEFGRARTEHRAGLEVYCRETLKNAWKLPEKTPGRGAEHLIAALSAYAGVKSWRVPADFPLGLARRVAGLRQGIRLLPETDFFPGRRTKNAVESGHLRAGVALAEAGLERAMAMLAAAAPAADGILHADGAVLTAERLQGAINARIAELGGTAAHTIAAPGLQGADPHQAGRGPITGGVPIVIDIFPRVCATGYFGDLTRTVVKGRAAPVVRKAFAAVQAAHAAAIRLAKPGAVPSALHAAAVAELEAAGFKTDTTATPPRGFIHGLGHGLGLEIHEAPRVAANCNEPLQPGNVITIEPGLYYPEWGGIRIEDVLLITPDGHENLTAAPVFLEIP